MNRACRICQSEYKEEIGAKLGQKLPYRAIAKEYQESFDCDLHLLEQSVANHQKHILVERELTKEQTSLLDRFGKGEVSLTEMSGLVAKRVFEKMLKNPDDVRFVDFFRTELLRQKEEESKKQNSYAVELITRAFSGHLPPKDCPKCGYNIIPDSDLGDLHPTFSA